MQRATICLLVLFCSLTAFAQTKPQWTIVKTVAKTNQTASVPETTLLTPKSDGLYRVQAYLSGHAGGGTWTLTLNLTDLSGQTFTLPIVADSDNLWTSVFPIMASPMPGTPVTYEIAANGNGSSYSFAITIERLQKTPNH